MKIKVLGTGCASCQTTMDLIDQVAKEMGADIALEKVEDLQLIMQYGVMTTPGVVIDEKVVHAGGIPERAVIEGWLKGATDAVSGDSSGGCCGGGSSEKSSGGCCS